MSSEDQENKTGAPSPEEEEAIATEDTATEESEATADEANLAEEMSPEPLSPDEEIAKWKDAALRSRADLDNYRKRIAREQEDSRRYANANLLGGLLPVLDNFQMGLEAARNEDESSMLYQGMAMVARQIDDFLSAEGAEEVEAPSGADFDPNLHEAVSQEPSDEIEEGKVMRVLRRGFVMRGRLLRPANVVVSSGASTGEEEAGATGTDASEVADS